MGKIKNVMGNGSERAPGIQHDDGRLGNMCGAVKAGSNNENNMCAAENRAYHEAFRPNVTGIGALASVAVHSDESAAAGRKKRPTARAKNAAVTFESGTDPLGSWTGVPADSEIPTQDADDL